MTHRQAKRAIEALGYNVIATSTFKDGVSFEASNGRRLAKGEKRPTTDEAMSSCYREVLTRELG